ncbi:MAG TPA: TIGR03435 family protein, partial [Bryobacteraceae bacterium]|nr:TIGR03435 family protein [Bryobacteraceae bacterium]
VYLLTKGPQEPMFEPPKHPEYRMFFAGLLGGGNGTVSGGNATMEFIASQLSRSMGGQVIDRTGLTGLFDFRLEHVYDPEEERDLVTIAQRTVRALGLKLERSRGPVEMIVIDHLENPSAN